LHCRLRVIVHRPCIDVRHPLPVVHRHPPHFRCRSLTSPFCSSALPVCVVIHHPSGAVLTWGCLSSAPPLPPTSSGSQAGWWHCVMWHPGVVVQRCGPMSRGSRRRRRAQVGIVVNKQEPKKKK
jgi:hypothetical protein